MNRAIKAVHGQVKQFIQNAGAASRFTVHDIVPRGSRGASFDIRGPGLWARIRDPNGQSAKHAWGTLRQVVSVSCDPSVNSAGRINFITELQAALFLPADLFKAWFLRRTVLYWNARGVIGPSDWSILNGTRMLGRLASVDGGTVTLTCDRHPDSVWVVCDASRGATNVVIAFKENCSALTDGWTAAARATQALRNVPGVLAAFFKGPEPEVPDLDCVRNF